MAKPVEERTFKFTKKDVEKIPYPTKGRVEYRDSELKGFRLRVSNGTKMYVVLKRVNGRLCRVKIGEHNTLTAEEARKRAQSAIAKMNDGVDINQEKRQARLRGQSLEVVFQDFLEKREFKPNTIRTYESLLRNHLNDWLKVPLKEITPKMVSERHKKIKEDSGKSPANNTMRTLRAIYNHGKATCEDWPENPVNVLKKKRQWVRIRPRKTAVESKRFADWFAAIFGHPNKLIQDYFLLVLFTGLRREEVAGMKWENIDLDERVMLIPDTKNHRDHILPMSDYVFEIFQRRFLERTNAFVFPGDGSTEHLVNPWNAIKKIRRESGIVFSVHDLRRTFATVSERVVSFSTLKMLLNHAVDNDVTLGYVSPVLDELREAMQTITTEILRLGNQASAGEIVVSQEVCQVFEFPSNR